MTQAKMPEPLFWFRPRSDDGYEGPLHDAIIGEVRKQSGAWIPFFSASQMEAYAAAKVRDALDRAIAICDAAYEQGKGEYRASCNPYFEGGCDAAESIESKIRALIPPLPGPVEPTT